MKSTDLCTESGTKNTDGSVSSFKNIPLYMIKTVILPTVSKTAMQ